MAYPYGLTDIRIYNLTGADVLGTAVQVPAGRVMTVDPTEETVELTGYNGVVASDVSGTSADLTLEFGGVDLDVFAKVGGGTVTSVGTTPNIVKTYKAGKAGVARPYVAVIGKALDGAGDVWIVVWKCKFNIPGGNFNEGEFYVASIDGRAVRNANGDLIDFITHETAAAIAPPA
jgi:hypothetical protein